MKCSFCDRQTLDGSKFCCFCGKILDKTAPPSDFEIGKIAALDTIKTDIRNWLLGLAAVAALVGFLGIREYTKSAVEAAVGSQLSDLKDRINKASEDAHESTARAKLQAESLDTAIKELSGKTSTASQSITDLQSKATALGESVKELNAQKHAMLQSTAELEQKKKQLTTIIEAENLTTIFAKMRQDFYRIRTLDARIEFEGPDLARNDGVEIFPFAFVSLQRRNPKTGTEENVIQFRIVEGEKNATGILGPNTAVVVYDYTMFVPFRKALENQPMDALDGIDRLLLTFNTHGTDPTKVAEKFTKFLRQLKEIRLYVILNSVPLRVHRITKPDIKIPPTAEVVVTGGYVQFEIEQAEEKEYRDVKSIYANAIMHGPIQ